MHHALTLYTSLTIASLGTAKETILKNASRPCPCPASSCYYHESNKTDHVQIMRIFSDDRMYCLSTEPVKWTFGSDSDQMPSINPAELEYESGTSKGQQFCLSLRVLFGYRSWSPSTTFVKCETNGTGNGSSRWYELRRWVFGPMEVAFSPKIISEHTEGSSSTRHMVYFPVTPAVLPRANEGTTSALNQIPDACAPPNSSCLRELSSHENDHVRVDRCITPEETRRIICLSSEPIKWIFSLNSSELPHINSSELQFRSSQGQPFCLSLRVISRFPSWNPSALFAKCVTNRTSDISSRWYELDRWRFRPRGSAFNPARTSDRKDSSNEALNPKDLLSTGNTSPVKNTIDHSTADRSASVPVAVVIGTTGGAAAFVILSLIIVVILLRKVKQQRKQMKITREEIDEFLLGVPRHKANAKGMNELFVLPYDTTLEIPKSDVTFCSKILGSGAFGQVVKGQYQDNQVAIKMLKNNADNSADYLRSLLGELKVMSYLGSHPNLVALIGAVTENIEGGEAHLILEYCSHGNVQSFVRSNADNFVDLLAGPADSSNISLSRTASWTTKDLVRWAHEVASGMEYVSAKNVYHGDLAARNILLTDNLTAKVGDFGLSKQLDMERYSVYVKQTQCPLPVKWMAVESLRNLTFSIQSDVWSYGVTLWELFTLGATPYPGMDWNFDSWKLLCEGKRLDKPEYASDSLYNIMMKCWDAEPKARPSFAQLKDLLNSEL